MEPDWEQADGTLSLRALPFVVVVLAAGCTDSTPASTAVPPPARPVPGTVYRDATRPLAARVDDLLSLMTLEEKVDQMHGTPPADPKGLNFTTDNDRLGIPGFRMVDGMRGVSVLTGPATTFPVGSARGATFDPDLEMRVGRAIGEEARARGANVILAPTINVLRHPRWGRAQETYGEDPFHIGTMAAGFVRGAQDHVIANAKHFAANSIENTRFVVDVQVDERTLREVYLPHFKRVVGAGVGSVMSAYNKVNGAYCGENSHLLSDILKGEWGFDGFVESDWVLGTRSTVLAVDSGLDIEMPTAHFYGQALVDAVESGAVQGDAIDDAVRRILRAKFRFGIFDGKAALDPAAVVESAEHTALAREAEEKAIVLLQNTGSALPLDRSTVKRIAMVGALANTANIGDLGSSATTSSHVVTPLEGISKAAGTATLVDLSHDALSTSELAQVDRTDAAIVVVGLTSADEGEGLVATGDRKSLQLSPEHEQLVHDVAAHSARTIVVLEGGSSIVTESFVGEVEAMLMAWYPGMEGGTAIAEVLFGDVNPSGKLPVSFPRAENDLPPFDNTSAEVTYGLFHGYRHLDHEALEPRFPFGFGLTYTTFAYSNLRLAETTVPATGTVHASVDVTNTGSLRGDEIVELYVGCPASAVERPVRELEAFERVSLVPGDTKTVDFAVDASDLAYWDGATRAMVVEPADYVVEVGSSSRDLPVKTTFMIAD